MADQPKPLSPELLAAFGLTVPEEAEREALLANLASMRVLADSLYTVEGARYVDPMIGWTPAAC